MPQMMPMSWTLIMIFSIVSFIVMNSMCYPYWNSTNIKNYFKKNSNKYIMNIKW